MDTNHLPGPGGYSRPIVSRSKPTIVLQERQCSYCGSYFRSAKIARSVVCEECKLLRKAEQQAEYQARRRYSFRSGHSISIGYHIIHDPDPENGYPLFAIFPKEEVRLMLTEPCQGFNPGTILEDSESHRFLVVLRKNGALKMVPWQNEQTLIKN